MLKRKKAPINPLAQDICPIRYEYYSGTSEQSVASLAYVLPPAAPVARWELYLLATHELVVVKDTVEADAIVGERFNTTV